jgi:hypothetical protein
MRRGKTGATPGGDASEEEAQQNRPFTVKVVKTGTIRANPRNAHNEVFLVLTTFIAIEMQHRLVAHPSIGA